MTYKIFKTSILSITTILLLMLSSCVKPLNGYTDFSQTSDFVILQNAGMANFGSVAFNRGSDTVNLTVRVDLASAVNPSSATTVTIAPDPSLISAYNTANPLPGYLVLPTANYKLLNTTLTIPAGQHYAETTLQVYTKGLDPALSYMLPISIKDASGKQVSGNLNTVYYHTIGNPLAGTYSWSFYRWNSTTDTTTAPNSTVFTNQLVSVSPLGPLDLLFPESYINTFVDASGGVTLEFTNTAGVLSNFTGFLDPVYQKEITDPAGVFGGSIVTSSVLVGYQLNGNAANHYAGSHFRFFTVLKNSSGGIRTMIDDFVKQ
jgi:hypothetical protein